MRDPPARPARGARTRHRVRIRRGLSPGRGRRRRDAGQRPRRSGIEARARSRGGDRPLLCFRRSATCRRRRGAGDRADAAAAGRPGRDQDSFAHDPRRDGPVEATARMGPRHPGPAVVPCGAGAQRADAFAAHRDGEDARHAGRVVEPGAAGLGPRGIQQELRDVPRGALPARARQHVPQVPRQDPRPRAAGDAAIRTLRRHALRELPCRPQGTRRHRAPRFRTMRGLSPRPSAAGPRQQARRCRRLRAMRIRNSS